MTRRISPCDDGLRHRWTWRPYAFTEDDLIVWERRCARCRKWWVEV